MEVRLNGFGAPDYVPAETVDGRVFRSINAPMDPKRAASPMLRTRIADARVLQAAEVSESAFFARHGFVLLAHRSAVADWQPNEEAPADSDIARFYLPEIEEIIRDRLLPGRRVQILQRPTLLRRGAGTSAPFYGAGVHQDFGLEPDDYQFNIEAFASMDAAQSWRHRYDQDEVEGFVSINFWRTTNMVGALEHMPLTICDPNSVAAGDVIPTRMTDIAPSGRPTNQMELRYNASQQWYYYPRMTADEVLAFKIFERVKADPEPRLRTCFHSAFEDPSTPEGAERRQSCEHRVGVFLLRD